MSDRPSFTLPYLEPLIVMARQAGEAVMAVYATAFVAETKNDDSPVTAADQRAEKIIVDALRQLTPTLAVVAEEEIGAGHAHAPLGSRFWLVDPLDGTREFVARNGEFTINIALIADGAPLLGVVYAPAVDRLFGGVVGHGAFTDEGGTRRPIACRTVPDVGLTVVASRSHGDAATLQSFLQGRTVAERRDTGSSLKFCLIAAGEADLYPRFGRTMEWDTAAGHAVLAAAGGEVMQLDGTPLRYGKPGFENPHFVAVGNQVGLAAG